MVTAIYNATLYDSETKTALEGAAVLWENGIIIKAGQDIQLPDGCHAIDAGGAWVTPGFIDGYSRIGLKETGIRKEGDDSYEISFSRNASSLSVLDGINPFDPSFQEAREYGITALHIGPGQENIISGTTSVLKPSGTTVEDMTLLPLLGAAVSLGEIPKAMKLAGAPVSRMGIAALVRDRLRTASTNHSDDLWSALFEEHRSIPLFIRAHRADDIVTALRLKREFGIQVVIVHATDGHLVSEAIAESGVPVIGGPYFIDRQRDEVKHVNPAAYVRMHEAGIPISFASDHPTSAIRYLALEASLAIREGLPFTEALYGLTLGTARTLGIDHRVGSLTTGKDADLLLWDGEPLELTSTISMTIINGSIAYERERR
ncbi:amidohydrolase family protein [Paenibacillus sp. GCM10023252]|uniref:amidohydrolase family protein n=1 Tax=Paenibacillus sp. GCM10023252 TaxID=3252649 RepID=UPI003605F617